jgi:secernin
MPRDRERSMCDTFVALGRHTADGSVIFGKNSDRVPNEAQALEYHGPREYPVGTELRCTHLVIPQAQRTHGVLISRIPPSRTPALTGMDLLRLALERSASAREALDLITDLLERYGQGGLHSSTMVYHNSFIIADLAGEELR